MAIYHVSCSVKTGPLQSAVAASAYISGETIRRDLDGTVKRYGRAERITDPGGIMMPEHVPDGIVGRATLWNAIEAIDGRRGQMCRSWNAALPCELSLDQQRELALEFIQRELVDRGMIADWAIHSDAQGQNPHLHILTTMRPIVQGQDGCWKFGAKARSITERDAAGRAICIGRDKAGHKRYKKRKLPTIDWNEKSTLVAIRAGWAAVANAHLERAGEAARIDHRSYADQGVEQLPTIHMGYAATAMERRGERSARG
ncbi:MAG: MobA/MobL family protein, partial [Selenomonadaceae bacterium]|nr:MobA/MobL family protein [Selenomonadaceae bacterium]